VRGVEHRSTHYTPVPGLPRKTLLRHKSLTGLPISSHSTLVRMSCSSVSIEALTLCRPCMACSCCSALLEDTSIDRGPSKSSRVRCHRSGSRPYAHKDKRVQTQHYASKPMQARPSVHTHTYKLQQLILCTILFKHCAHNDGNVHSLTFSRSPSTRAD
jgi:hypothetical protein